MYGKLILLAKNCWHGIERKIDLSFVQKPPRLNTVETYKAHLLLRNADNNPVPFMVFRQNSHKRFKTILGLVLLSKEFTTIFLNFIKAYFPCPSNAPAPIPPDF